MLTVLQQSSTCQLFRLLTVCCQRYTNQPIVFCVVRPTLNSLALAKRAVSLFSSRAAALVSRVWRLRRSRARALLSLNLKKRETACSLILITRHCPDLGSDWSCSMGNLIQLIRSTSQISVVMCHKYGISALVSQT